jgi:16S rRNA (cytosine967-C5)-methyltransferase
MEPGFTTQDAQNQDLPMRPHRWEGCWLWQGEAQRLARLLDENPRRRVQDPASTQPIQSTQDLRAKLVIDFCAGRGTKTRQLLALHPQARVVATDPEPTRLADLEHLAEMDPNVQAIEAGRMGPERFGAGADLLVLDVPCSNTAVLARRPEARYRFGDSAQNSVIELQRRIVEDAQRYLKPGGFLLYCTCSLQRAENEEQATWIAQRFPQLRPLSSHLTLPGGQEETYHDGSFSALFENAPA